MKLWLPQRVILMANSATRDDAKNFYNTFFLVIIIVVEIGGDYCGAEIELSNEISPSLEILPSPTDNDSFSWQWSRTTALDEHSSVAILIRDRLLNSHFTLRRRQFSIIIIAIIRISFHSFHLIIVVICLLVIFLFFLSSRPPQPLFCVSAQWWRQIILCRCFFFLSCFVCGYRDLESWPNA